MCIRDSGRIVHEFYGTIYANKENGKLESNKRMWLYEKIHISISVSYTHLDVYKRQLLASDVTPFAFWYEGDPEGGCIRFLKIGRASCRERV